MHIYSEYHDRSFPIMVYDLFNSILIPRRWRLPVINDTNIIERFETINGLLSIGAMEISTYSRTKNDTDCYIASIFFFFFFVIFQLNNEKE